MSLPVTEHRPRRWWIVLAVAAALAILAASVAIIANNGRSTPPTVALVASATPGPNPFTESVVAATTAVPAAAVVAKSAALRKTLPTDRDTHLIVASGTVPGLYGGSGRERVCDPGALAAFLAAHPDKAAAWAGVQGITAAGIDAFVATLTPVLLNSDTLVTNYGFVDGKAAPYPAVLQAGTAVLVDAGGTPRAKCNCGNPLAAPELLNLATATMTGTPWPGYVPGQVTMVQAGKSTGTLTLVDVATGGTYAVGPGAATGLWVSAAVDMAAATPWNTTISTSPDGKDWTKIAGIPGESVYALASGNGVWVAAASKPWDWGRVTPPSQLFASTDLRTWRLVASLADHVSGIAYGADHWIAIGYKQSTGTGILAWQSTDALQWVPAGASLAGSAQGVQHLAALAYGDGQWVSVVVEPGVPGATFAAQYPAPLKWTATSTDGLSWNKLDPLPGKATDASLAFGDGEWLVAENRFVPGVASGPGGNVSSVAVGSDGSSWTASPVTGIGSKLFSAVAYGDGRYLAAMRPFPASVDNVDALNSSTFLSSTDAKAWAGAAHQAQVVQALAFGPTPSAVPVASTGSPASSTAAAPATAIPSSPVPTSEPDAAPCTADALLAVVNAGRPADQQLTVSPANIHCTGAWLTAGVDDTVNKAEYTVVLQRVNGAWKEVNREAACNAGEIPANLVQLACNSN